MFRIKERPINPHIPPPKYPWKKTSDFRHLVEFAHHKVNSSKELDALTKENTMLETELKKMNLAIAKEWSEPIANNIKWYEKSLQQSNEQVRHRQITYELVNANSLATATEFVADYPEIKADFLAQYISEEEYQGWLRMYQEGLTHCEGIEALQPMCKAISLDIEKYLPDKAIS